MTESREAYVAKLHEKLEEWNVGMDELQERVDRAEAHAQREHGARIEALRGSLASARTRLAALEASKPEEWNEHREGMEEARDLLEDAIEEARRELGR